MEAQEDCTVDRFPVWKTVTLGGYKNGKEYRAALHARRVRISDVAGHILSHPAFTVAQTSTRIDLGLVSPISLGFDKAVTYNEICLRARQLGLRPCPAEVGPALRLAYDDQPHSTSLYVVMDAVPIFWHEAPFIFGLAHMTDSARWLYARDLDADDRFGSSIFIFEHLK